jgi:membrane associated rhomboid family serine protease
LTTEIDEPQRPSGEVEPVKPRLVVLPGGAVSAGPPPAGSDGPSEALDPLSPPAEPADQDLFAGGDPYDGEFEGDDPTPLPDVSFLSVHPSPGAFFWAVAYAVLSGVITLWASWDRSFHEACLINGHSLFLLDAPVRLFASMLLHSGLDHYLGNMILLVPFAGFTTAYYGFWAFPVILVTLGVVTHLLTLLSYPPYLGLVGSSGLLFAVFGFWLVLFAWVESHLSLAKRVLRLTGFSLMMLIPHSYSPKTSYRAHYIGLGLGALAAIFVIIVRRTELRERTLAARLAVQEARKNGKPGRRLARRRAG